MTAPKPYQVCLYVGENPPTLEGVKVVDLTPAAAEQEPVLEQLRSSGLTPADLRARVYFLADGDRDKALAVYSALLGFAGRRLDISGGDEIISATDLDNAARSLPDAGRPEEVPDQVQIGAVAHPELPSVVASAALKRPEVSLLRYARRVRFVPLDGEKPALAALSQLIVVAGIRARRENDRLPYLCNGDEPAPTEETANDVIGLCLDTLRRAAVELRRSLRFDDRGAVADALEPSDRQRTLLAAAALPIEETMARLGARQDPETELWHCPRPDRHTNGDANASMKIVKGKVQCFRCDPERVDSLRLVMDTKALSADEAADWLLSNAS